MPSARTTPTTTADRGRSSVRTHDDENLARYLGALDAESLLPGERETAAALQLVALRQQYWRRLLAPLPLRAAMVEAIVAAQANLRCEVALAPLRAWARRRTPSSTPAELEAALEQLAFADCSCELADRLAADVHALASGGRPSSLAPRGAVDPAALATDSAGLHGCRAAITAARDGFARANLRLVVTLAHRYQASARLPLADLIQEGNVGLLTAVDRFDPRRGFRFSTYGSWWIRHAISRALSDTGRTVRLPVHVIDLQCRVAKARRAFEREHGRAPELAELAGAVGLAEAKLAKLELVPRDDAQPVLRDDDEEVRGGAVLAADDPDTGDTLHDVRLQSVLEQALAELDEGARDILRRRFGLDGDEPATLREVGEAYSLSRERIRQLQAGALQRLRAALEREGFVREDLRGAQD
ncbi:MAG: RNA polymerase sigma factor RpoD/SigA [Nannocystaceae bacterium]|nr:RNA polymerase sigma factor RpoD/SigA [Nannocystaceae bacterium]